MTVRMLREVVNGEVVLQRGDEFEATDEGQSWVQADVPGAKAFLPKAWVEVVKE
jgi:hypothetical protein